MRIECYSGRVNCYLHIDTNGNELFRIVKNNTIGDDVFCGHSLQMNDILNLKQFGIIIYKDKMVHEILDLK
jgi:hypothetical protein